jgi:hypothetical protein
MLNSKFDFRLKTLILGGSGFWGPDQALTSGISKTVSYWYSPTLSVSYSGNLWELQPVEVRARPRPAMLTAPAVAAPEQSLFDQAGVSPAELSDWMKQNNLGLAVVRNVTSRDAADLQQPFNLKVGTLTGTQTITGPGTIYTVSTMQFMQADQLRGMGGVNAPVPGRRVLAQPMHDTIAAAAEDAVRRGRGQPAQPGRAGRQRGDRAGWLGGGLRPGPAAGQLAIARPERGAGGARAVLADVSTRRDPRVRLLPWAKQHRSSRQPEAAELAAGAYRLVEQLEGQPHQRAHANADRDADPGGDRHAESEHHRHLNAGGDRHAAAHGHQRRTDAEGLPAHHRAVRP